jgi:hypothetical protein
MNPGSKVSYHVIIARDGRRTVLAEDAMASALEYLVPRMHKWAIPLNMVLTHGQVSPGRKTDIAPGDAARFKSRLKAALN